MACCAMPGGCEDPACYLCTVVARLPQPSARREVIEAQKNAARDGDPSLAGERKRGNKAFRKSNRAGASYVPSDRRV